MFEPIIHNLSSDDAGFAECQAYNKIIAQRPKGSGNLASKIAALSAWKTACRKALALAEKAIGATYETKRW